RPAPRRAGAPPAPPVPPAPGPTTRGPAALPGSGPCPPGYPPAPPPHTCSLYGQDTGNVCSCQGFVGVRAGLRPGPEANGRLRKACSGWYNVPELGWGQPGGHGQMGGKLTRRQRQIYDYIKGQIRARGYPPSVREIGEAVGLRSSSTVHGHLNRLEEKGYIRRDPTKPRAIEIVGESLYPTPSLDDRRLVHVPLVGQVT